MGLLLLVGAAALASRWWVQRRHAKKLWLQGGFHGQAIPTPAAARRSALDALGGMRKTASMSSPRGQLAPPIPGRRATRAVGWLRRRPRWMIKTWREGPPLGGARGR